MVAALVVFKHIHEVVERLSLEFPTLVRQSDDLVPAGLDGSCFVHIDVSGVGTNHCFIRAQHGIDDGGVGLGAAREQVHVGIADSTFCRYLLPGTVAEAVEAIGEGLFVVGFHQMAQHVGVGTVVVVAFEGYHSFLWRRYTFFS